MFDRINKTVRVRVSGFLVREGTLLLIAHRKKNDIYWLLPGGGIEFGESLKAALAREFREELGIEVEVGNLLFMCDSIDPRGKRHILNVSFRCDYLGGELRLGKDRRLHDFGFFSAQQITGMRLYPPVNGTLVSILGNGQSDSYLGSLWLA
ncbi:MAG TPA: NUDIX domain-containing protein [Spirochaetota bacterium]|nr:NUDIX domain-containing protein [Spirochaetota bacterium]HOD16063.1 NUDIX domain-containing protein [Spirochaetota bacterium]HPG50846.1 NUDIX domain-containing protein [Spirochaetota bacterium]HPN13670.1 NUDIX domain-containing protein [Spirochaetota bacterium]